MKNMDKFIEKISYGESYFLEESSNKVLESFDIQIQGNQYRHKVNFSLEDKDKLGDLERICDSIKEKTCLYHFNLEDNPILQKSSSRKKWKTYDKRDFYDYALIKKHLSSKELIDYIKTDVRKIEAHLKIVKEIILENMD